MAFLDETGLTALVGHIKDEIAAISVSGGGGTSVDGSDYIAGRVFAYAGTDEPIGALLCDGRAVSRTTYWELFAAIGTTYGSGDGLSTFNLPNIESRTIIGESDSYALGATGGEEAVSLTAEQNGSHTHAQLGVNAHEPNSTTLNLTLQGDGNMVLYQYGGVLWNTGTSSAAEKTNRIVDIGQDGTTGSSGGGAPHNNMQPYIVMRYFITTGKGDPASGINPADYVVEWGKTDNWTWKKYASGIAECWGFVGPFPNASVLTSVGFYYFDTFVDYPFPLTSIYNVVVETEGYAFIEGKVVSGTTNGVTVRFSQYGTAANLTDNAALVSVKGFWKDSPASGGTESIAPTIEERFESLEPVVLYDNASGTTGTVTLSETAANFTMLEIYFVDNDSRRASSRAYSPDGKTVALNTAGYYSNGSTTRIIVKVTSAAISGSAITAATYGEGNIGATGEVYNSNSIKITQVLGYR